LESGALRIILQAVPKRHPELPNVPLVVEYAKAEEARRLIQVGIHDMRFSNKLEQERANLPLFNASSLACLGVYA